MDLDERATAEAYNLTNPKIAAPWLHHRIIALSGVSCSGKTTLAQKIVDTRDHVIIVHQDDYYYEDLTKIPKVNGNYNWDDLDCIDHDKLLDDVLEKFLKSPSDICPTCLASGLHEQSTEKHVILIEGAMLLSDPYLRLFDHPSFVSIVYLKIEKGLALDRRKNRDYGHHVDPPNYFSDIVWPNHLKISTPLMKHAKLIEISASGSVSEIYEITSKHLPDI